MRAAAHPECVGTSPLEAPDLDRGCKHGQIACAIMARSIPSQRQTRSTLMAARILNGNAIRDQIYAELRAEIADLANAGIRPGLAAVLVGDDPASKLYVNSKIAACEKLGLGSFHITPPATISTAELLAIVNELNERNDVDGILVQMPLPKQVDSKKILRRSNIPIEGANAVVIGRSDIVGKPQALQLMHANATVTLCHSKTKDLREIARRADIVVAAIGKAAMVTPDFIRPGATVIDVGQVVVKDPGEAERIFAKFPAKLESYRAKGSILVGDVHPDVVEIAGAYTPVPGGVGPLTIAMLMSNTVKAARMRRGARAPVGAASRP